MNEIKTLLNEVLENNDLNVKATGKVFTVEKEYEDRSGVQPNEDYIRLYNQSEVIAIYDVSEQDVDVLNWDHKEDIKVFVTALEENEFAVYVDEKLLV